MDHDEGDDAPSPPRPSPSPSLLAPGSTAASKVDPTASARFAMTVVDRRSLSPIASLSDLPMIGWRGAAGVMVALLLLLASALPAAAHQEFRASQPASGDTLGAAPSSLRLTFTQSIPTGLARLRLAGPGGDVALGAFSTEAASTGVLLASIEGALVAGAYTIHWQVTGDDGHAVQGQIPFFLMASAAGLASPAAAPPEFQVPLEAPVTPTAQLPVDTDPLSQRADLTASAPYWAIRWLNLAAMVALVGAASAGFLLIPRFRRRAGPTGEPVARLAARRTAVGGLVAAALLAVSLGLRLYAQVLTVAGPGDGFSATASILLRETRWGNGWLLQAGGIVLAGIGFVIARRAGAGWAIAAIGALLVAVSAAMSGHAAATSTGALIADTVHVVAAGGWIGTLLWLGLAALPAAFRADPLGRNHPTRFLAAFSPMALTFAALLAGSGVFLASQHLGGPDALLTTDYGHVLTLKLLLVVAVLVAGAYNWRRSRPRLEVHGEKRLLRRTITIELVFAAAVLAVTAALIATPPADHGQPDGGRGEETVATVDRSP